jgi:hypothetical protein
MSEAYDRYSQSEKGKAARDRARKKYEQKRQRGEEWNAYQREYKRRMRNLGNSENSSENP